MTDITSATSVVEARKHLGDLLSRAQYRRERILVTRNGSPVAVIISIEDFELLRELEDKIDLLEARVALAEAETEGLFSWEDVKAEAGL